MRDCSWKRRGFCGSSFQTENKKAAQGRCAAFEMVLEIAENYFAAFLRASALLVSSQVMSLSSILPK